MTIAGTKWTTANLTGSKQGDIAGFAIAENQQDAGMFWKWGSKYMYDRTGGAFPTGHWGTGEANYTLWAATSPVIPSFGYDYGNGLVSTWGAPVGDPCKSLGKYRTPTRTDLEALKASGSFYSTYKNVTGYFFGVLATSCDNEKIQQDCIFIPMAGYRNWTSGNLGKDGIEIHQWSSSVYKDVGGWYLGLNDKVGLNPDMDSWRGNGFSVRCVVD